MALFNLTGSDTEVAKYKSRQTGLTVVVAKADTPVVHGHFCFATRADDDDGLPHILEHLIFQGSEDYPYQEALDLLATRCLGERTNAWTARDHTCYTLYTAGTSGFLDILPIYLDHILFPQLRVEDYLTEVHHVNGAGEDAGVVYSEMQGSKFPTSVARAIKKLLYPGDSGYYALTGGGLKNLRTSTNIQKVRNYHKKFYRAENLVLTITGSIDPHQIFKAVTSIEEKILGKKSLNQTLFEGPWQKPLQPIKDKGNRIEHKFPSDDESKGKVYFGFRLTNHITEDITMQEAYYLLLWYLMSGKVSPLEIAFVETEDPLCTSVGFDRFTYSHFAYIIGFSNVPTNRTGEVIPRLRRVIQQIIDDGPSKFDLSRIRSFIDKGMEENQKDIENNFHKEFSDATILDQLYGTQEGHFQQFVTYEQWSTRHRDHNASYWLELLNNIFNNFDNVVVEGKPSISLSKEYNQKEKIRLEKQRSELGQEGLDKKREELLAAIASKVLPNNDILTSIPFGDVEKIQFRTIKSYNRTLTPQNLFDFSKLRLKVQISDVKSKL